MSIIPSIKVEDDLASVPFVSKNGYYRVGNKNFNFKINALEEATRTRQEVIWDFNTNVYQNLNWRVNTNVGLKNLYRIRAQQLRNKYDYLVLSFSGGADSFTVLKSFIDNNIKLDEIICDWPISYTESKHHNSSNAEAENYLSEWDLAIKPMLKYVAEHHPDIKITVTDSLAELTTEDAEDTCTITQIHNYISVKRYRLISNRLKELNDRYAEVAIVLGIEKPIATIERDIFCVFFSDEHCWFKSSIVDYKRNVEYFYWSADLPEIVLEQGHAIFQQVKANKQLLKLYNKTLGLHEANRNFAKGIIYPDWNPSVFQANKGTSLIYNEQYSWFFNQNQTREVQSWESSMTARLALVDPKYLCYFGNSKFKGYEYFHSRLYPIGKL